MFTEHLLTKRQPLPLITNIKLLLSLLSCLPLSCRATAHQVVISYWHLASAFLSGQE